MGPVPGVWAGTRVVGVESMGESIGVRAEARLC